MFTRTIVLGLVLACSSLLSPRPAVAGGNKAIEQAAKAKKGSYFLKIDVPYMKGRHSFGSYKKPLVLCSAQGLNTKEGEGSGSPVHSEGSELSLRVNDQVKVDDLEYDDDQLDIEIQGTGQTDDDDEGIVAFVGLRSVEEFDRCWNEVFSNDPVDN